MPDPIPHRTHPLPINILPIPKLPEALRAAAQAGKLVPFVGAGVSKLAGCPGWSDMANSALRQLVGSGKLSYAEFEQCKTISSPRIRLSIAESIASEHSKTIDYRQILERSSWQSDLNGLKIYGALGQLGQRFVTTNYDAWLDNIYPGAVTAKVPSQPVSTPNYSARQIYYKTEDFTAARFRDPNTVIHLHGSLQNQDSMILTMRDYISHYANDRGMGTGDEENTLLTFLEHLFRDKTVLFLGYGLQDLEILEYVVQKARGMTKHQGEVQHFMLQGYFSYETALAENMARYYGEECGISLLPFLRDNKDYEQLIDVLIDYARNIPAKSPMVLQDLREMERMI